MAKKYNDFSDQMNPKSVHTFTINNKEFKVKQSHKNFLLLSKAQTEMQKASILANNAETDEEKMLANEKSIESQELLDDMLKIVLGEKQFKTLEDLELSSEDYMNFFVIVIAFTQGASYETIKEGFEEAEKKLEEQKDE